MSFSVFLDSACGRANIPTVDNARINSGTPK